MGISIEKYKQDIEALIQRGNSLGIAIKTECDHSQLANIGKTPEEIEKIRKSIPNFRVEYQAWYSEAKILIRNLLPDRLDDFVRYYEKPKSRKIIDFESYRIEDYLQGVVVTNSFDGEVIVGHSAAIPLFYQQIAIVKALSKRFQSSLFDIKLHLQAEMFDDELDAAEYLLMNKFTRAAGAIAGVILERHLKQICLNYQVTFGNKKNLVISDLNDALKKANILETSDWRRIQLLGDIRNNCDHDKKTEPKEAEVQELIDGVKKIIKTY